METGDFDKFFTALTRNSPFPWQTEMFRKLGSGSWNELSSCTLPTGLGKTSVIPIWLIAVAASTPNSIPRRLVYVVNRRTVVDQATEAAEAIRKQLCGNPEVLWLRERLTEMCAAPADPPLAISTLRGQFADNREWSADPARPAVIVGTVDMIGSRLLFEGYGCGFKTRPLHAGFLGQDVLLVHDEAHLEPAFQCLLEKIRDEQHERERTGPLPWPKLRVMGLTATPRGDKRPFELTPEEQKYQSQLPDPPTKPIHHVWRRLQARKGIGFHAAPRAQVSRAIGDLALRYKERGKAVLVYVHTIDDVNAVQSALTRKGNGVAEDQVAVLTGTIRGRERDRLATENRVFARFLAEPQIELTADEKQRTVYLVCTSAGEVGVDISAEHMVSDLTPLDSMAQRFGRINRRGGGAAELDVVYENDPDPKRKGNPLEQARWATLDLLRSLPESRWITDRVEASPREIGKLVRELSEEQRSAAFTPKPEILNVNDILFDAWTLTTLRGRLPARPPVEDWLHGVSDRDAPETHVAWREEVLLLSPPREMDWQRREEELTALFDEFPLKPHELLRDRTTRVQESLAVLAQDKPLTRVWVIEPDESVRITTLGALTRKDKKGFLEPLGGRTVVLPPTAGGLTDKGTLDGSAAFDESGKIKYDVAGVPSQSPRAQLVRLRATPEDGLTRYTLVAPTHELPQDFEVVVEENENEGRALRDEFSRTNPGPMRVAFRLDLSPPDDEDEQNNEHLILKSLRDRARQGEPAWPALDRNQFGVKNFAQAICERIILPPELRKAVVFAAACHDLGKDRGVWQRGAGNSPDKSPVAKPLHWRPPENLNGFRHEFASLIDVQSYPELLAEFENFSPEMQDVILHLIAAHHGRGRPHFPGLGDAELRPTKRVRRRSLRPENSDPERPTSASALVAAEVPSRFARLQRQFGRWGLAYLESLVRAADALDSRRIEESPLGKEESGRWPKPAPAFSWPTGGKAPVPAIRIRMEPTNPGQFFACCGLLELAHRLWAGAEGWFDGSEFCLRPADVRGQSQATASRLIDELAHCRVTNEMTDAQVARLTLLSQMKARDRAKSEGLEAEKKDLDSRRRESPICLHAPFKLRIDWFRDDRAGGSRFKTWAGQQSVIDIAQGMHRPLLQAKWSGVSPNEWLSRSVPVDALPFYFDSWLSGQGSALDAGFSFDPLGFKMPSRPLLELAAFIGLQRFRPLQVSEENLYRFDLWPTPLLPSVAAAAACGAVAVAGARRFEFRLLYRTKYLKSFLPAQPFRGDAQ